MRFNRIRRAANLCIIALLLFLFLVPERYLAHTADTLTQKLDIAQAAAEQSNLPAAQAAFADLHAYAERTVPPLKLFMTHAGVDALLLATAAAVPMDDRADILSAAAGIRAGVEQLREIECFSFKALF